MRHHLHNASWQGLQFERCKNLVNINTAVFINNFARNFATSHQDEVKSSAFSKYQILIHAVPMYFIDVETNNIMQETLVITSDIITHDCHAVSAFSKNLAPEGETRGTAPTPDRMARQMQIEKVISVRMSYLHYRYILDF